MAHIFVIDDDDQLLRMVGLMLERGGFEATLLNRPQQALDQLRQARPDLLVLDVMMPGLSGHELCRQIRATKELAGLPILIMTARAQEVDRIAAMKSGADDYISKPVTSKELLERIGGLLARRQSPTAARPHFAISLFSLRGGVGRTTLAVNLAATLQRQSGQDVCLLELAPAGGQANIHLRLPVRSSWVNLSTANSLDWAALQEHQAQHASGLRLLSAPVAPQSPASPSAETLTAVLALLRQNVTYTVIDLPPLWTPAVLAALAASDLILHVVTADVVTMQMAIQGSRALAASEAAQQPIAYLLNQTTPEAALPPAVVERALNTKVAFRAGYDPGQARALAQGQPLALASVPTALPAAASQIAIAIQEKAGGVTTTSVT